MTSSASTGKGKSKKAGDPRHVGVQEQQRKPVEFRPGTHEFTPVEDFDDDIAHSDCTSQAEALYYMLRGDNVMLCGQAGTGKSWVVNTFCDVIDRMNCALDRVGTPLNITITASTGAAAALIHGQTIHSWSGLGIEVDCPDEHEKDDSGFYVMKTPRWKAALKRIRMTDILIIDEISMLPAYFITNLDKVMKMARRNDKPFGGVQVIMVGDFLQLPPVDTGQLDKNGAKVDARMCFHSPAFGAAHPTYCYLDNVRRSNDDRLTNILNAMRSNNPTDDDVRMLNSRCMEPDRTMQYTRLYTRNRNVDRYNKSRLLECKGEEMDFYPAFGGDRQEAKKLKKRAGIPDCITLRPGAVVMLTQNNGDRENPEHVNGSIGKVVGFEPTDDTTRDEYGVIVRFNDHTESRIDPMLITKTHKELVEAYDKDGNADGYKVREVLDASVRFMPLKLAWAITVHKSQGQTLDGAIIDLHDSFQKGLGYVAISRVHSLDDIILLNPVSKRELALDDDAFRADMVVRRRAKQDREELFGMVREHDENERMSALLAGNQRRKMERWLGKNITPGEMFKDDLTLYEWLRHRANHRFDWRAAVAAERAAGEENGGSPATGGKATAGETLFADNESKAGKEKEGSADADKAASADASSGTVKNTADAGNAGK